VVRFREGKERHRHEAWRAFYSTQLPSSYEDVANEYGDTDQIGLLARLQAVNLLMQAVQRGVTVQTLANRDPSQPADTGEWTPELREHYLNKADRLAGEIFDADDGSEAMTIFAVNALNARAAIAESLGKADAARGFYEQAATRADARYAGLAKQARERAESVGMYATDIELARVEQLRELRGKAPEIRPVPLDDAVADLVLPDDDAP
jgi:hypothetical protein